jgi:NADPH2:quinone reductase
MKILWLTKHGSANDAFQMRTEPDPVPGPGQVRIAVEASGINFADILARRGAYPEAPKPPGVLGFEVVGRVDAGVSGLLGRRVLALTRFGGYASHVVVPESSVVPLPDGVSSGAAAALGTQGVTAWLAAEHLVRIEAGDHVLVHSAAGGVGNLLVQLAHARGAVVIGTVGSDEKFSLVERLGGVPIRSRDFASEFLRRSGGRRPDVIFDAIGGSSVRTGLALLATGGRLVSYGVASLSGGGWALPRAVRMFVGFGLVHPLSLLVRSKGLIGLNLLALSDERPELVRRALLAVVELASTGSLVPVVDREFPAAAVGEAHAHVESRRSMGKVVLTW